MSDHHVIAGQLVTVRVPYLYRGRSSAKARLVGYGYYQGVAGGEYTGAVVRYTADHGEPFSHHRRERGEEEVVPFDRVLPRNFTSGTVTFHYDESIPAYAGIGPVHVSTHHHPTQVLP